MAWLRGDEVMLLRSDRLYLGPKMMLVTGLRRGRFSDKWQVGLPILLLLWQPSTGNRKEALTINVLLAGRRNFSDRPVRLLLGNNIQRVATR